MIRVSEVQRAVADLYGISPTVLTEPDGPVGSRRREHVRPRQLAMYLARQFCSTGRQRQYGRASLVAIGRKFGGRDHTTILHGCRTIERLLKTNSEERRAVGEIGLRFIQREGER
jgi:chromosomal replication initiator protein